MNCRITGLLIAILASLLIAEAPASGQSLPSQMAAREWHAKALRTKSKYYDVVSTLDRATTQHAAEHMDRVYEQYARILSGLRVRRQHRLSVYLFATQEEYMATLDAEFDTDGRGTAGVCAEEGSKVTLAVWQGGKSVQDVKRTLQHEGFHQFARALFDDIPPWADEGIAELFESAIVVGGRVVLGEVDQSRLRTLHTASERQTLIPFKQLFRVDREDWLDHVNAGDGNLQYAQAWAIVHFLIYAEDGRFRSAFEKFLAMINAGRSWENAFAAVFGSGTEQAFQDHWLQYLMQLRPTDYQETVRRLDFLAAGMLKLRETEAYPTTLVELQAALNAAAFTYRSEMFGRDKVMSADDAEAFMIPLAPPDAPDVKLALVEQKKSRRNQVPRKKTEDGSDPPPAPMAIVTEGLFPINFAVEWSYDRKTETWSYEITPR